MIDQFYYEQWRNFVYLITDGHESLVVDPQRDISLLEKRLAELDSKLVGVLLTHTHYDHIGGISTIGEKYSIPIYVHPLDVKRLAKYESKIQKKISLIKDGQEIFFGKANVEVMYTPGHSAGECCYLYRSNQPWSLFTGDTVFVGEVGRTDLETGSDKELFESLSRLKKLPPDTVIYPGHDYGKTKISTIGEECKTSPAFLCHTVEELAKLP